MPWNSTQIFKTTHKGKFRRDIDKLERNFSKFVFNEQKLKWVIKNQKIVSSYCRQSISEAVILENNDQF